MTRRLRLPLVVSALLGLAACSDPPTAPPPPPPDAPTLSCPASIAVASPDGAPVPVNFVVPTAVGGQLPVVVSCSRLSGSPFALGSTLVTCTATDALARSASCNFNVAVTATPRISKTSFLAFGDSITEGRCGPKPNVCPPYTSRLAELLRERYANQTFVITTRGVSGELATEGKNRLEDELKRHNPEVLLLMEGTNDLLAQPPDEDGARDSLEDMIDDAREHNPNIVVFLATIPPIAPGGPSNSAVSLVAPFNDELRALAARKNVPLVDVFAALSADINRYFVGDDLHPTAEGLRLIGETFYASIRKVLDITPGGGLFNR